MSPLLLPISVLPDPSRSEQVPGHRTGSGSMLLAFALSSLPKNLMLSLLVSLEIGLLQQSSSRAPAPFWSQRCQAFALTLTSEPAAIAQMPVVAQLGEVRDRAAEEVQGTAHSLRGASRVETPSAASLPQEPPASARTPLVTGNSLPLSAAWAGHGWPALSGRRASSS